ncbi:gamma-glutamyltransferase [Limibaculum sp. FT325]|uniref:gamma-glutamyltransferase n=1 Tax=Thermohalobaculum sediminis TaxID=2939436 RepID=UPI0020BEA30D|nr:gamma-glutamyltransferase [Limibaculum sediminis]MCL5777618.1 gamma-glutamyltransferase [Limibaculum sediminis]
MSGRFAIAAGHALTAEAGAEVLRAGGNAVDAAIAAAFAAMVAEPVLAGLMGGGFLLVRRPSGEIRVLDAFVQTPRRKRPLVELDLREVEADFGETRQRFVIGAGAVAAPGLAPALAEAHRALGRMPLAELAAPAIRAARDGVRITAFQAAIGRIIAPILTATPSIRALMCDEDVPFGEGVLMRNPDLAEVLDVFTREGPRFIQEGEVAAALLALMAEGGHLTVEDLRRHRAVWREPVRASHGPATVALNPPPALGGTLIAFALGLVGRDPGAVELARAFAATARARLEAGLDGDPVAGAARLLDPALLARYRGGIAGRRGAARGTTHVSLIDGQGLGVALTLTNGEGAGLVLPGTGIIPNNMLGEDDLVPGDPLNWEPDQRLASMMAPLALGWPDGRVALMGSGGSNRIRTALAQVVLRLAGQGMGLEAAIAAPRLHVEGREAGVDFELEAMPDAEREALLAAFPEARGWSARSMFFGGVHAVMRDARGHVDAAGDPRRDGVAITG